MSKRAPAGLGAPGKRLWREVAGGLTLRPDELVVLEAACRTADQVAELEALLAKSDRMVPGSKNQLILHPAIPELRQQRQQLASLLGRLDIPEEGEGIGGEWDNLTATTRARKAAAARWRKAS